MSFEVWRRGCLLVDKDGDDSCATRDDLLLDSHLAREDGEILLSDDLLEHVHVLDGVDRIILGMMEKVEEM